MLARLFILMPYTVTLVEGQALPVYEGEDAGYKVRFLPPMRSSELEIGNRPHGLTMDGLPAFEANVMRIDFWKEEFARAIDAELDPPPDVVQRAVNWFHSRLRYVTRAAHAKPVSFPWSRWKLEYTNDDGSPLEQQPGLFRGRGTLQFEWSFVGVTRQTWEEIFRLPRGFDIPTWDGLRLDAHAALPSVGASVVLGAAALETFISVVLDDLSKARGFSQELWEWINERGNWLREPTVEERFDVLLKHFCGHSLKDENSLWEGFKNLRTARNSFVHEGIARIGGAPIDKDQAAALVRNVDAVVSKVREWLPEEIRWPQPVVTIEIGWQQRLFEEPAKIEPPAGA
jgi:hypothetical protein